MRKTIFVVTNDGDEEPLEVVLASQEEFQLMLANFNALCLTDTNRMSYFGLDAVEQQQSYTLRLRAAPVAAPVATYPPFKTPDQPSRALRSLPRLPRLPASPPRDGITCAGTVLERQDLVSSIIETATPIAILHSSPATGKTSLLDLICDVLSQKENTTVVRLPLLSTDSEVLINALQEELGVNVRNVETLPGDTWILLDDAQLAFDATLFWVAIVKYLGSRHLSKRIHIVIAATYDLANQGSTPYAFVEHPHIYDLKLSTVEAEKLYDGYIEKIFFARNWIGFKDTLLELANGHVGVLSAGINMLHRVYNIAQKQVDESDALDALRDHRFRALLARCFPCKKLMNDAQRKTVMEAILNGPFPRTINASEGTLDDPSLVQLVRAGVLSSNGTFSCKVAQWQYFNSFYSRPAEAPASLEDLIVKAVASISALRLCQSQDNGSFPKEAAFQHLFNEAMTMQLPPSVAVCPELNTFAKDSAGNAVTGELDFYIAGDLNWAVELLRKGDKINEHVERFDSQNGKYRLVGHTAHLVIDCRGPRSRQVETMPERCTLYFADNFATAECKMRDRPIQTISLKE